VCFCKDVKGSSVKFFREVIRGFFEGWGVSDKGVKARDIRAVLGHRDKVSYNNVIVKARGLVKG
jgi:hypothetical protein